MARYLDLSSLPESVARYAEGQVAIGRFASIEEVLAAGVEALEARDEADRDWIAYARRESDAGFAALDRGEGIQGTADEHMARIDAAVRARTGK